MRVRPATILALGLALVLCPTLAAAVAGKSKVQRIGTSTQVETSEILKGKKKIQVTGELQSSLPHCERQRSVLLYQSGPTGDLLGGAIGHGVSRGGTARGQFEILGEAPKKISPTRRFILEAVGRKVKVKGKEVICKRGVSIGFLGDFN